MFHGSILHWMVGDREILKGTPSHELQDHIFRTELVV